MSNEPSAARSHEKWARFRFSLVGPLLAAPPKLGELKAKLQELAAQKWLHPISGQWADFGLSSIERWYYIALNEKQNPLEALRRKRRCDQGGHPAMSTQLRQKLATQHQQHPNWSYQLHADNLLAILEQDPQLGTKPSYASVLRFMKAHGLFKRPRRGPAGSPGAQAAERRFESREIRSYESEHVNALWHLDFHHGSLRVLLENGQWAYPILLCILDDHSRLCCHAQWYLSEGAQDLCHGLCQALQKRALPRALMSDNGSAMLAAETVQGLARLSIVHETTLPYSPYQNGKQESFWGQIEGRLLPMLEGVTDLTLRLLNESTQAWVEMEYNHKTHSELGMSPLRAYIDHKDVGRPCPASTADLQLVFTSELIRTQRRSDGTISLGGVRFEIPSRYGHFQRMSVRVAAWDLSRVHLCDPISGTILCRLYPLDKHRNAQGERALKAPPMVVPVQEPAPSNAMAPLLQQLIKQYAATGSPAAYLPKDELSTSTQPPAQPA